MLRCFMNGPCIFIAKNPRDPAAGKSEICAYSGKLNSSLRNFHICGLCIQHLQQFKANRTLVLAYYIYDVGQGVPSLVDGGIA